jgi:hypothetical protein
MLDIYKKKMLQLWYDEEQEGVQDKLRHLKTVSNPKTVIENAQHYFNDPNIKVYISPVKNKKYAIYDPIHKKLIHFGDLKYEDYSFHNNSIRRENYLKRASNIRGNWRDNPYSPNNMSQFLLWNK